MGRSYMVDPGVQLTLNKLVESAGGDWSIGLVIGQFSAARDYVVHVAVTPRFEPPTTCEAVELSSGDGGGSPRRSSMMKGSESRNSLALGKTLDTVNEKQVTNHARQAHRMLTGGLDILGIFVIAHADDMKTAQPKLRQVLYSTHKFLSKLENRLVSACHNDRVLLHLCPLTKKYTCRTFDVSDNKSSGTPAEWKFLKSPEAFTEVTSRSYSFDTVIPVTNDSLSLSLQKQIVNGLSSLFKSIQDSIAVSGGRLVTEDSASLSGGSVEQSRTRNKKQQSDTGSVDRILVDLIYGEINESLSSKPAAVADCGARLCIRGTVATKAFVQSKSTIGDAISALKTDIIRSLTSRCELLCEDLLSAEEDQDASVVYETPTRVFVLLPGVSGVKFCDYLFQDETTANSAERFKELLGIEVDDEDVDSSSERIPDENDLNFGELHRAQEEESEEKSERKCGKCAAEAAKPEEIRMIHWIAMIASLLILIIGVYFFPS